jgi:23S rRNA-/tRNA-specific pseudouridylate synthase
MLSDNVLFIDAEAIVVNKPAGLPVDAPRDGALSVENHLESLRFTFKRWPVPVHRLDRDTSGCLLLARTARAQKRFSAAFEAGRSPSAIWRWWRACPQSPPAKSRSRSPRCRPATQVGGWCPIRAASPR